MVRAQVPPRHRLPSQKVLWHGGCAHRRPHSPMLGVGAHTPVAAAAPALLLPLQAALRPSSHTGPVGTSLHLLFLLGSKVVPAPPCPATGGQRGGGGGAVPHEGQGGHQLVQDPGGQRLQRWVVEDRMGGSASQRCGWLVGGGQGTGVQRWASLVDDDCDGGCDQGGCLSCSRRCN